MASGSFVYDPDARKFAGLPTVGLANERLLHDLETGTISDFTEAHYVLEGITSTPTVWAFDPAFGPAEVVFDAASSIVGFHLSAQWPADAEPGSISAANRTFRTVVISSPSHKTLSGFSLALNPGSAATAEWEFEGVYLRSSPLTWSVTEIPHVPETGSSLLSLVVGLLFLGLARRRPA